jgi:predicted nucleic acid-binding protein
MSYTSAIDNGRQFVDTNLVIYSLDSTAPEKRAKAEALLDKLWRAREGCVSVQVLQEFFVVATTKLRKALAPREARQKVAALSEWTVHRPGPSDLLAAIDLQEELRISFWDAMIIQSARSLGCEVLWTEDPNDGQRYAGVLIRNPFTDSVME